MPRAGRTLLLGPLAIVAVLLAAGWLVLGVLAVALRFPAGLWPLVALAALALAVATAVVGLRSAIRLTPDELRIPGRPPVAWADVAGVRLEPSPGGWAPVVDITKGRALEPVLLDGLLSRQPEGRVRRQADALATAAGCNVEVATPPTERVGPRHSA